MTMKVRWLVRADGNRWPGAEETVEDHIGESFLDRGLVERIDGVKVPAAKAEAMAKPGKKGALNAPVLRGEREE